MIEFNKKYDPKSFEKKLQDFWENEGYFKPQESKTGNTFYIPMPPPNVTGKLHLGHALTLSVQDIMVRYHRMKGDETLYVPGTDHAGISTQAVVEKKLESEGRDREEMGRDKFLEEVWKWKEEYEGNIHTQTRLMGASSDWSKARFTLDEDLNKLVEHTFVDLYNKGLIYKGKYMVNYSPKLKTVVSDAEVIHKDVDSKMYYITYFVSGTDKQLTIATTRPETLLADQAVAVNPRDKRFKKLIGRDVILPLVNKKIPIIGDERVDINFGTGALKITPAHDPNDFEIARDHDLRVDYEVITKDGIMNLNAETDGGPSIVGQDTETARGNIVEMLKSKGNLEKVEDYKQSVGFCERSGCRIETVLSEQWFVGAKKMSEKVIAGYKKGDFDFIPDRFRKIFEDWIFNLRDWCVSRQLWWGHQIPAYYDKSTGELLGVTLDPSDLYSKYGEENVKRDDDVLDTWFSAGLWPYSVLDWKPENPSELFNKFYPAQVLETGYDIIFFWVIRMLLFGYEYTGKMPFEKIYLHGLILDENGAKMSKSKGNGIDPIDVIDKYSTDSLRLALTIGNTPGNNFNFSIKKVENNSLFLNKLWNVSRFVLMNTEGTNLSCYKDLSEKIEKSYDGLLTHEKWIISKLKDLIENVTVSMEDFTFNEAAQLLKTFTKNYFADYYIEEYKLTQDISHDSDIVVSFVLLTLLKLWHPYAPHVTEEIYNKITGNVLINSSWPSLNVSRDILIESQMDFVTDLIKGIRNIRAESGIKPSELTELIIISSDDSSKDYISNNKEILLGLSKSKSIDFKDNDSDLNSEEYSLFVIGDTKCYVNTGEFVSTEEETNRLEREIKDKKEYIRIIDNKLLNPEFVKNAPERLVRMEQDKRSKAEKEIKSLQDKFNSISK